MSAKAGKKSLREMLLSRVRTMAADEPLPLRLVFWDGETFDFGEPRITITLATRAGSCAISCAVASTGSATPM